jgi:nucleoside-diphosphate-sugar epimerase
LFQKNKFDFVVHLAGRAINREEIDAVKTFEVNVEGTINIAEQAFSSGAKGIIFASSGKVYGKTKKKLINEKTELNPEGIYPLSKAVAEGMIKNLSLKKKKSCLCLRFANVYGPKDYNFERIVPGTIKRILNGKPPIIHGNGRTKRNFVFIDDAIEAITASIELINEKKKPVIESVNVSSGSNSLNEIVNELIKLSEKEIRPLHKGKSSSSEKEFSINKAKKLLKWKPKTGIKKGLKKTFEFYSDKNS